MATLFVDLNATGSNDGSAWNNAYTDLQDAIAASQDGDQIWVADGTYKPTSGQDRSISFQLKSGVEIYGGFAGGEANLEARNIENNQTILSGDLGVADDNSDNSYHVVEASNTNSEALLDGFFITAGNANFNENAVSEDSTEQGGGIYAADGQATFQNLQIFGNNARIEGGGFYAADPLTTDAESRHQFTNVVFQNNTAARGGGISNDGALVLENVEFIENEGSTVGGGISNATGSIILTNSRFVGNSTNVSGGAIDGGDLTLTNVEFVENVAEQGGGAIGTGISSNIYDLNNVNFINNTAEEGGAIFVSGREEPLQINNARFESNSASELGGAIYVDDLFSANPEITNSVFDSNNAPFGGAIYVDNNNATIVNSTFANNQADNGAAIFSLLEGEERPTVTNSIIYDNQGNAIANEGGTTVVTDSIVQGGYEGGGNLDSDPLFLDSENSDLRIAGNSPGIDVGNNEVVADLDPTNPPQDIAGIPRIFNNTVDLGAYEFNQSPFLEINDVNVNPDNVEGDRIDATFTVSLVNSNSVSVSSNETVTVNYTAVAGTASPAVDFEPTEGTITFAPQETEQEINISLSEDIAQDLNFSVVLSNSENAAILDNEGVATVGDGADDSASSEGVEVYRFINNDSQLQFYTTSETEKDFVVENLPNYGLEGVSFIAAPDPEEQDITGVSPVYRLFNPALGIHLYTISEAEKDFVVENLPNYTLEGVGYYGYDTQQEGTIPLYRFFNPSLGAHFYTPNAEERDFFINSPDYQLEGGSDGIAFYVEPAVGI